MDPNRSRKLAHLSYVAPLVAALTHAQLLGGDGLAAGGYRGKVALTLVMLLLVGGFTLAVFVFGQAAGDRRQRIPALVGVVANIVAALLISASLMSGAG